MGKIALPLDPIRPYQVRDAEAIERAFETLAAEPNGGLITLPGALMTRHRDLIISLAARHRMPNIFAFRFYVGEWRACILRRG